MQKFINIKKITLYSIILEINNIKISDFSLPLLLFFYKMRTK